MTWRVVKINTGEVSLVKKSVGVQGQCFFFARETAKCPRSSILGLFWLFSRAKIGFLAHFFPLFWQFSRPFSKFLAHSFWFFSRVDNKLSRAQFWDFSQAEVFFFSVTLIFHSRLYVINPHSTGRKPPAAFFKNRLEERPFVVKKIKVPPQVQIKIKNTLKERQIFL